MRPFFAIACALLAASLNAAEPLPGSSIAEGFTVTQFAGPELANDISTLHIDAEGRIVVAGRGYVRHLIDTDGDGRADRAVELIPPPAGGPMGLLWESETLYAVVDGGLQCYRGATGKKPGAEKPTTILAIKASGEHDAHALKRGPDGALYLLCGNSAGISAKTITDPKSPLKETVAGGLLRIDPKTNAVSVFADGFRNPYDFDFTSEGRAITFDSDNERCVGLPWFEPTRLYHIRPGGNYGWLNPQFAQTWRRPPDFPDVVAPILTAGRGSPTGVACYRHTAFPEKYRDGVFFADWTFGKIHFSPLTAKGETLAGKLETFLESTGDNGFAPTGMAVNPKTGDLYVATGGRGTRGAVYRIHAKDAKADAKPLPWRLSEEKPFERITGDVKEADWVKAKTPAERLLVLRKYQISLGDLGAKEAIGTAYEGYTFRRPPMKEDFWESLDETFTTGFPTGEPATDRELVRIAAAFESAHPNVKVWLVERIAKAHDWSERIHALIALSRMRVALPKKNLEQLADAIVALDEYMANTGMKTDTNWPLRVREVLRELFVRQEGLAAVVSACRAYGRPGHLLIAQASGIPPKVSAAAFVRRSREAKSYAWAAGQIEFLTELPSEECRPILEALFRAGGFEDAVVVALVRMASPADVPIFKKCLGSTSAKTVVACLRGLEAQRAQAGPKDWVTAVKALRRFADTKADAEVRAALVKWLRAQTKQTHGDKLADWEAWLRADHPDAANELSGSTGYDAAKWKARLSEVKWDEGDAERGRTRFAKAHCAACHNGAQASGPSLEGVSKRFGRDDLLTAILDPNRDVSPRYRTTRVTTQEDKVYEGIVIYEATDGVILQTGADTTVRIAGKDIQSSKPGTHSLMPTGLLDEFPAAEVADLIAYLKTLDAKK